MTRFLLDRVSVVFRGEPAVDRVSLEIRPGERVGIVGPSGAGKTTLLRMLVGAVRPQAGRVLVDDRDLRTVSPRELRRIRSAIGFVHQDHCLVPTQRALTNVLAGRLGRWSFPRAVREVYWPRAREVARAHALLERAGIPEKLYQRVDTLSGGQRQRVAIARALYQEPRALLADEPVSSVDPARAQDTVALLSRIAEDERLTLCVSLHNIELARQFFPRLIGMRRGQVVFDALSAELSDAHFHALYDLAAEEMMQDA